MKIMSTKRVWVSFLIVVFLEGWFCEGCRKQERDALLHLNALFEQSPLAMPGDWVDGTDCCLWENVECNSTTKRVAKLSLGGMFAPWDGSSWNLNMSDFQEFHALESLDLSYNNIAGCVQHKGSGSLALSLNNLKHLHLGSNLLNDSSILPCFSSMEGNKTLLWQGSILEDLDLSSNSFSNDIIPSIRNLKRLKRLRLGSNRLQGSVDISKLKALTNLKMLDLSGNKISSFVVGQGTKLLLTNLKALSLSGCEMNESMLRKSLRPFQYVKNLNLANNQFKGTILPRDFGELDNLEDLELAGSSNITCEFFRTIGSLTSLKVLSMSDCRINGTLPPGAWSKLKKLEKLDLSHNQFEGPLPTSFANMTSLRTLDISDNSLAGNPVLSFTSLTSLEFLDFSYNQFDIPASFTFLANYSNLQFIYGDANKVIADPCPTFHTFVPKFQLQVFHFPSTTEASFLPLPNFLVHQYNLTWVDFSSTKYGGEFPNWLLENNTNMKALVLRNCTFRGHFQLPLHPIPNIQGIDISNNTLTGQIPGENISSIFPNLGDLDMSRNAFHGPLPQEFDQMSSLSTLDLSYNELDGFACPTLATLNILSGLYLQGNTFSGSVESCFNITRLESLDISDNHFVGKLPTGVLRNMSKGIRSLSMANNNLEGSIPREFFELLPPLQYIDLSENNLSGSLPSLPFSLITVHLSNNKLSGLTTMMFNESSSLRQLDLSNNDITGHFQVMGNASNLNFLLLKGNHFVGQIPNDLCKLRELSILDLSYNKFSCPIPKCVGEIPFTSSVTSFFSSANGHAYFYKGLRQVHFTTKKRFETFGGNARLYMSGVDLSHNELNENIPLEFGNMTNIRAINLSHNHLTGRIPMALSNLKQLESLDLSFNRLIGEIPPQFTELTSLEVFSLAYNNLSGRTPDRKNQFITFDESSYDGNPFLCGAPLNKTCSDINGQASGVLPNASNIGEHEDDGFVDKQFFYISFAVSYTTILSAMMIVLYINPHWRRVWFYFIEFVIINNSYYFVVANFRRWFTTRNV